MGFLIGIIIFIAFIWLVVSVVGSNNEQKQKMLLDEKDLSERIECPACKELVKWNATVCRFCGYELATDNNDVQLERLISSRTNIQPSGFNLHSKHNNIPIYQNGNIFMVGGKSTRDLFKAREMAERLERECLIELNGTNTNNHNSITNLSFEEDIKKSLSKPIPEGFDYHSYHRGIPIYVNTSVFFVSPDGDFLVAGKNAKDIQEAQSLAEELSLKICTELKIDEVELKKLSARPNTN